MVDMAEMRKRARSKKAGEPAPATPTPESAPPPSAAAKESTPTPPAPSLAVPEPPAAPEPSIPPEVAALLVEEAPPAPVEPPPAPPEPAAAPKEKPKKQAVAAPAPAPPAAPPPPAAPVPVPASPVPPAAGGPTPPASAAEARKESAPVAATIEHVLFALGDEEYAIPIEKIVEIVPYRSTTPVPNADETVLGILSLRGVVVTILDVRSRLGGRRVPPGPDTRFIVLGLDKEMVGLFVDRVRRVVRFAATDIEPPPRISSSEGSDCVAGVVERGGRIVIVLDLDRLLAPEIVEEIR